MIPSKFTKKFHNYRFSTQHKYDSTCNQSKELSIGGAKTRYTKTISVVQYYNTSNWNTEVFRKLDVRRNKVLEELSILDRPFKNNRVLMGPPKAN